MVGRMFSFWNGPLSGDFRLFSGVQSMIGWWLRLVVYSSSQLIWKGLSLEKTLRTGKHENSWHTCLAPCLRPLFFNKTKKTLENSSRTHKLNFFTKKKNANFLDLRSLGFFSFRWNGCPWCIIAFGVSGTMQVVAKAWKSKKGIPRQL